MLARLVLAVSLLLAWGGVPAHEGGHRHAGAAVRGQAWGFTLPTLDGERFVRSADLKGPVLVNFWGRDCPPCLREFPLLAAFARENPGWTVLLVATDPPAEARAFLVQHGVELAALRGGANVAALMRAAGNRIGALPFTVGIKNGAICATHVGELSPEALAAWSTSAC